MGEDEKPGDSERFEIVIDLMTAKALVRSGRVLLDPHCDAAVFVSLYSFYGRNPLSSASLRGR
jgi:hypothetical protein